MILFLQKIKKLRLQQNISQKEIADNLNISQSVYSRWESGKQIIPFLKLFEIACFYKINLDYLFNLTAKKGNLKIKNLNKVNIGNELKYLREKHEYSQKDIAHFLKTTQSTISAIESGKVLVLTKYIYKLSKKYNVSIDYICSNEKEMLN